LDSRTAIAPDNSISVSGPNTNIYPYSSIAPFATVNLALDSIAVSPPEVRKAVSPLDGSISLDYRIIVSSHRWIAVTSPVGSTFPQ